MELISKREDEVTIYRMGRKTECPGASSSSSSVVDRRVRMGDRHSVVRE